MRVFFLFLGLSLGFAFSILSKVESKIIVTILSFAILFLSFKKKEALWFLLAFGTAFGLGILMSMPIAEGQKNITGIVYKRSENYVLLCGSGIRVYVSAKGNTYQVGDVLNVQGYVKELAITSYESRFDFEGYLRNYGTSLEVSNPRIAERFLMPFREIEVQNRFLSNYNNSTRTLLSSILFNRKDYKEESIGILSSMNLLFLYSSSGMFLSKFLRLMRNVFGKMCEKEKTADLMALLLALCFVPLTFSKIGLGRVILVCVLRYYFDYIRKVKHPHLEVLSWAGIIQFILFPFSVLQTGFQLGYGIAFTFTFFGPVLGRNEGAIKKKLASFLFLQAIVLPASINFAGSLHLLTPVFSYALSPFAFGFWLLGVLSYATFPFPALLNPLGEMMTSTVKVLKNADLVMSIPRWDAWICLLYYGVFFLAMALREIGFPSLRKKVEGAFVFVYLLSLAPVVPLMSQGVYFVNVGQGDCILIHDRNTNVLIDTGGSLHFDMAEECLIPFFRSERIYHIDCLIASHHDFDHIGAKDSLMENFRVKSFVDEASAFPLKVGNLYFENFNVFDAQEENEASLVLKLDFMGKKWLFTGDATIGIENQIMNAGYDVDCDVLKVGHHGSDTSTSTAFLLAASPEEAVISVGEKNTYGHPKKEVMERLEGLGIKIRRTDKEGTIRYAKFVPPWV